MNFGSKTLISLGFLVASAGNLCCQGIPNLNGNLLDQINALTIPEDKKKTFQNDLQMRVRQNLPRIVFVPGILGSKINECRSDGSQCKPIWGTAKSVTDYTIDLSIRDDRTYPTDVVDEIFFKKVYGTILDEIRMKANDYVEDTSMDPILNVFHYDWRQSNVQTSQKLKTFICTVNTKSPESPIILVAHSMGGLATKLWLRDYSEEKCGGGTRPNILRAVFVGTPHLGAPKTVKSIAQGYNILFDEIDYLDSFRRRLAFWETNYLLASLNRAGMTFPSFYELLPIQTSAKCLNDTIKKLNKIEPVPVVDKNGDSVDLFDAGTWSRFDLLRQRIDPPAVRFAFYRDTLPKYLESAQKILCSLVEFDPPKHIDVMYIVGNLQEKNTFGWFRLATNAEYPIVAEKKTAGDGTVPEYSARNISISASAQVPSTLPLGHMQLASSSLVLDKISGWFQGSYNQTKLALARGDTQVQKLLAVEAAATGQPLAVPLDASKWVGEDFELLTAINSEALTWMGQTPSNLASLASSVQDAGYRSTLYALAASTTKDRKESTEWTTELAYSAYEAGRYEEARDSSNVVLASLSSADQAHRSDLIALEKRAAEVNAWANLKTGDTERFGVIVATFASKGINLKQPENSVFFVRHDIKAGDQMLISNLTGTEVRNAANESLGDISDILLDKSGKPTVAIIGVGGFLGMDEKNVGVPFESLTFTTRHDNTKTVARLDATKDALQAAPKFVHQSGEPAGSP